MEAAVTVTEAIWCAVNQVINGPPHIDPRTGEGFEDELQLAAEGIIELEHEPSLVELLCSRRHGKGPVTGLPREDLGLVLDLGVQLNGVFFLMEQVTAFTQPPFAFLSIARKSAQVLMRWALATSRAKVVNV